MDVSANVYEFDKLLVVINLCKLKALTYHKTEALEGGDE